MLLVGPVVKIDPAVLPRRPNIHFTGIVPYASLPSFMNAVDVAIMPFARNRATENISPTKTLEYFAARRPVLSTPIADVVREYAGIALIAEGRAAFVAAARDALRPDPPRIERGEAAARAQIGTSSPTACGKTSCPRLPPSDERAPAARRRERV